MWSPVRDKQWVHLFRVLVRRGYAFKTPTSAIQERMELGQLAELGCPGTDDLVAVVGQWSRPSCSDTGDVHDGSVNAGSSTIQSCYRVCSAQGRKNVVECEEVIGLQLVWPLGSEEGVEIVSYPV